MLPGASPVPASSLILYKSLRLEVIIQADPKSGWELGHNYFFIIIINSSKDLGLALTLQPDQKNERPQTLRTSAGLEGNLPLVLKHRPTVGLCITQRLPGNTLLTVMAVRFSEGWGRTLHPTVCRLRGREHCVSDENPRV